MRYDALLLVSFGGPEATPDVLPFLENVLRGKNVPRERMLTVAEHYHHFGGRSPINDQNRALITALRREFDQHGLALPIYWGNRNWHPMLPDTLKEMKRDGVKSALAFVTSAFSSYSGCRQYRENIANAQESAGGQPPLVDKLRVFYNHPGFIEPMAEHIKEALHRLPEEVQSSATVLYTAHSIPLSMAQGCRYQQQLEEAARLISEKLGRRGDRVVFQSRSGPASQPWLEPDVLDAIRAIKGESAARGVVLAPLGFVSDHMEVLYDLDIEARRLCDSLQVPMVRAKTVGTHPRFVRMIRELIEERISAAPVRLALGKYEANHDICPADCCLPPQRAVGISSRG